MRLRAFRLRPLVAFLRSWRPEFVGWGVLVSIPTMTLAGPSGEQVVAGGATITRPDASHTQIDQSTDKAIVNWSNFSVGSDEYVVFKQPGANASVLNRVIGSQQSKILGQVQANGRVYLVNPHGIYFAPGAKVDVGALTASALDISNDNFISGNYVFERPPSAPAGATVENAGEIKASEGGYVVLAGDYANNSGVISARLGDVVLAAGNRVSLDLSEDGLMSFVVDEASVSTLAGVHNSGEITANGGRVIMTAKVANDLVATAVNNEGLLQARRIVEQGGEIYLSANGGDLVHDGAIDVAGSGEQSGGRVDVLADDNITLTSRSRIDADGDGSGNGGTVNVIADGRLAFKHNAEIAAMAGGDGDRGGAIELSGHDGIQIKGTLNVRDGEVLIDPPVVTIDTGAVSSGSTIGKDFIETTLDANNDLTISATSLITKATGVTSIVATGTGDLRLVIGTSGGLIQSSSGDIDLGGLEINILGDFDASAGTINGDVSLGKVAASDVSIVAGGASGDIVLNTGGVTAAGGGVILRAQSGEITVGTGLLAGDIDINVAGGAGIDIDAGLDVTLAGDLNVIGASTSIDFNVGGDLSIGGNFDTRATTGTATVTLDGRSITVGDLMAYGANSNGATVNLTAINDIAVNNLASEIGTSGTTVGSGNALLTANAGRDITIHDIEVKSPLGAVTAEIQAGRNLTINSIAMDSRGDEADIELSAGVSTGAVTVNDKILITGTTATSLFVSGYDVVLNGTIDVIGADDTNFGAFANNDLSVLGELTVQAADDGTALVIEAFGRNGVFGKQAILAGPGGDASAVFGIEVGGGLGSATFTDLVRVESSQAASADINVEQAIEAKGAIELAGMSARLTMSALNIDLSAGVDLAAQSNALLQVGATNNLNVTGDVRVATGGGGVSQASYQFGNNAILGRQAIIAGDSGVAAAIFDGAAGDTPGKDLRFTRRVRARGGQSGVISATAGNSIRTTTTAGLLEADVVSMTVLNSSTTTIDVKTKTSIANIQNTGLTPNVMFDNRAFGAPSAINFGPGTVLKAASFLGSGAFSFNGGFTADNLAVAVTKGRVSFNGPVNITGSKPFLPSVSDLALFRAMATRGLPPPLHGPNVQIFAPGGITINTPFNLGGLGPFTKMFADGPFDISGLRTSSDALLSVFSPIDTSRPFSFENQALIRPLGANGLFNFPTISGLPDNSGTTVVVGELGPVAPILNGSLTIGANGSIDIGERNMLIISRGTVLGAEQVTTTGLFEVIGLPRANVFEVPIVDEFEKKNEDDEDDELVLIDENEVTVEEAGISEESAATMECS